ncbi:MAG: dynamin family protein [Chloroflexi bacterium]|nr:dynamin family protein [Chloroflexota bacterium]
MLTDLLEVLPKIDGLNPDNAAQARDALFHADNPYLMVFVGAFNSGKSSLINALLGSGDILPVGPVPTTDRISILRYSEQAQRIVAGDTDTLMYPAPILQKVSLVDTPGLESVFQTHESITRKFLHRADAVFYVMLATQAMSAGSMQSLQTLRDYGKKIILLVNQADLLTPTESDTVRKYVAEQSQAVLGHAVPVWLVSAKLGLAAQTADDSDGWTASGLNQIEAYVDSQLDDAERLRQKLLTPLQIAETTAAHAVARLKNNQTALDQSQAIADNVRAQITAQERDQRQAVRAISQEAEGKFAEVGKRAEVAIRDIFQLSRVLGAFWRGVFEIIGLARLFRRGKTPNYILASFQNYKVFEPLDELPAVIDKLAPRLEGRDLQDLDQLVGYTTREIGGLPDGIRQKVIGAPQAPVVYERRSLQEVRPSLTDIEEAARKLESERFVQASRTAVIYLALWELLIIVFGVAVLASGMASESSQTGLLLLVVLLTLAMLGLIIMPVVGRVLARNFKSNLYALQSRYTEALGKAADQQIEYSMRLRRDAVAPLTRLVEAQVEMQNQQLQRLHSIESELNRLEQDVNRLGRKSGLFGMRG